MKLRSLLIVPAALAIALLAGCGQGAASGSGAGSGSAPRYVPSNSMCYEPEHIRQYAPEGACTDAVVDDDLSPLSGR